MWPVRDKMQTLHQLAHYIDDGGPIEFERLEAIGTQNEEHYSIVVKDAPRYWRAWTSSAAAPRSQRD